MSHGGRTSSISEEPQPPTHATRFAAAADLAVTQHATEVGLPSPAASRAGEGVQRLLHGITGWLPLR